MDATRTLDLVQRAQRGDREALDRLFARYHERVLRIVRLRLGQELRKQLESGDILQKVFMTAMQGFSDFEMRDEASFLHWLAQFVEWQIHDALDYYHAERRDARRAVPIDATTSDVEPGFEGRDRGFEPQDRGTGPVDRAAVAEDRELVERCMSALEPALREILVLRQFIGFTWEQAAQHLALHGSGAARTMYAKALLALSRKLHEHCPDWGQA